MRPQTRSTIGMLLLGCAAALLVAEAITLMGSMGSQPSAGAAPAGEPPGWRYHATWFAVIAILGAGGGWLIVASRPRRNTPTHQRDRG